MQTEGVGLARRRGGVILQCRRRALEAYTRRVMGAWGEEAFQNDSALDWLAELEVGGLALLRETLSRVAAANSDDYLDVDDGTSAIAAAEIVAAALGRQRDRVTQDISAWLDAHESSFVDEDQVLAKRAVLRVLAAGSELRELWEEDGVDSAWHADVRVLLDRLGEDRIAAESTATGTATEGTPGVVAFEHEKQALVTFLRARGLEPTAQQLARIYASHDAAEVRRWLAQVVDTPSVAEMLGSK